MNTLIFYSNDLNFITIVLLQVCPKHQKKTKTNEDWYAIKKETKRYIDAFNFLTSIHLHIIDL